MMSLVKEIASSDDTRSMPSGPKLMEMMWLAAPDEDSDSGGLPAESADSASPSCVAVSVDAGGNNKSERSQELSDGGERAKRS